MQDSLRIPYTLYRKMNQGNADPGTLGKQVIVAVMLEGSDQPLTATFRADAVELAA